MTDKQIIIDGVNVACCVRLQDDELSCDLGGECKGWENCYYKQLRRKEQENKKLKEDEKSLLNIIDDLQKEKNKWVEKYNDLGQDFDQLKQTLTEIKEIAEPFCNACQEFEPEKSKNCINCTYCNYNKILQKISESEANNDR